MDYTEAMDYIHATHKFGSKLGLDRIRLLLDHMGNPQNKLKFVHVAGTNGKGSTVSFISNILMEAGYRVGIYTSPYINRFSERIRINESEISENDIAGITERLKGTVDNIMKNSDDPLTEFELVTAMAFQHFYEQRCDIVVLEVGLGGRLDSTNIIDKSEVSVITTIDYDHMDILGDTLPKIANEKAGIIKENCDVILYPQACDVQEIFELVTRHKNAPLHKVSFDRLKIKKTDILGQEFDFEEFESLKISLLGIHQTKNAAVAIKSIEILRNKGYKLEQEHIRRGLEKTKWPGRLEVINKSPLFLIDGAHNAEGAKNLAYNLKTLLSGKKITFIVGVLADKDYKTMLEAVMPLAERFITVAPNNPRALSAADLEASIKDFRCTLQVIKCNDIKKAIEEAMKLTSKEDIICSFGSLYYIGEVRDYFGLK